MGNMTGATYEATSVYPSGAPESTLNFGWGRVVNFHDKKKCNKNPFIISIIFSSDNFKDISK